MSVIRVKGNSRKSVNFVVDESLMEMIKVLSSLENRSSSEIVEDLFRNYILMNRKNIDDYMKSFWRGAKELGQDVEELSTTTEKVKRPVLTEEERAVKRQAREDKRQADFKIFLEKKKLAKENKNKDIE